jgi:hypothetical protein
LLQFRPEKDRLAVNGGVLFREAVFVVSESEHYSGIAHTPLSMSFDTSFVIHC